MHLTIETTADEVHSRLDYDPGTGLFRWKVCHHKSRAGTIAGHPSNEGYIVIKFGKHIYRAHRLAWFYVYGQWPNNQIDHIDGDKSNNQIANLREATNAQNMCNKRAHRDNPSGLKGVTFHKLSGKWGAQIMVNYRKIWLGVFDDKLTAHAAYTEAAKKYHGDFARFE